MALNKEDKADVKGTMGKALANKVSKVTNDKGVQDPFDKNRKVKMLRPTIRMGGTTTKNGKLVDVGMSKEWTQRHKNKK